MIRRICLLLLASTFATQANEGSLYLEARLSDDFLLAYENPHNVLPEVSEFEVVDFALMSNDIGERWVLLTVYNTASGRRTFNHHHIMALVADGTRIYPAEISQSVMANETLSILVNFGVNKFPLLNVYSRTQT